MRQCYIEASRDLRDRLLQKPYCDAVKILRETPDTTDSYILLVASDLLEAGPCGIRELDIDGDTVRFKPWAYK